MRCGVLLLSLFALSCAAAKDEGEDLTLTEATVTDPGGAVVKTITDRDLLDEVSALWRAKTPAESGTAMSDDYVIRLACSDGNKSTWYYDRAGYVRKSSERDRSVYRIAGNDRLLQIVSP